MKPPARNDEPHFAATRRRPTPILVLDPARIALNVEKIRLSLPDADLHYALKCNPDPRVARILADLDVGFEIASERELVSILATEVPPRRLLCLHPVKSPRFLEALRAAGVKALAIDSKEEAEKIARHAPGSGVLARIGMDGRDSQVPLSHKFGCEVDAAPELLRFAAGLGLRPDGLTMHVGSQCRSLSAWSEAIATCRRLCERLANDGLAPSVVSLGGGLPVDYGSGEPDLAAIGIILAESGLPRLVERITIEPGRAVVATAGTLIASVVGVSTRSGTRWVYLDAGIYQGLFEWLPAAGGFRMPITVESSDRPSTPCRLAGPTCDDLDVLPGVFQLPELRVGDRLAFHCAGSYTTSMSTAFNGFPVPEILLSTDPTESTSYARATRRHV